MIKKPFFLYYYMIKKKKIFLNSSSDPEHLCDSLVENMDDTELTQMIRTMMGEAQQIRGESK